jgi:large subunit ribosomal protein L4
MQADVVDLHGKVLKNIALDDRVFGITPSPAVVHQAVVAQQANARQGTHDTRTRGEVAGGGKKPYRQKGTGYARQGSKRAPHYKGGGVVFGPHPRSYEKKLPRKMRRLAMRSVLSSRLTEQAITIVDAFNVDGAKTKSLLAALATLGATDGAVIVLDARSEALFRAARNLERVHVVTPNGLNLLDILRLPRLILVESAIPELTRTLTSDLTPTDGKASTSDRTSSGGATSGRTSVPTSTPTESESESESDRHSDSAPHSRSRAPSKSTDEADATETETEASAE